MAGNTSKWRKSLAGLAAVATLATMGLVAGTASAAAVDVPEYTVKYTDVNGNEKSVKVKNGESTLDALTTHKYPAVGLGNTAWTADGQAFDFKAKVTKDVNLTSSKVTGKTTTVYYYDDNNQIAATITVAQGSKVPAAPAPLDVVNAKAPTGKLIVESKNSSTDPTADYGTPVTRDSFDAIPTAGVSEIKITPETTEGKTVTFNVSKDATATAAEGYTLNSAAQGENGLNFKVDVADSAKTFGDVKTLATTVNSKDDEQYFGLTAWYNNDDSKKAAADDKLADHDYTYNAIIKRAIHVTFLDAKDGKTSLADAQNIVPGEGLTVTKPTDPTTGGYFKNWTIDQAGNNKYDFATKVTTTSAGVATTKFTLALYGQWVDTGNHTVTYKLGYDGATDPAPVTYDANEYTKRPADPTREGYVFDGWYELQAGGTLAATEYVFGAKLTADVTLYAQWKKADQATYEAFLGYVNGSDKDNTFTWNGSATKFADVFTDASWTEYVKSYQDVQSKFAKLKTAADQAGTDVSDADLATLTTELKTAQAKLVFKHSGTLTNRAVVYRLAKGNKHMYTSDQNEIKALTSTQSTDANWTKEGVIFKVADSKGGAGATLSYFTEDGYVANATGAKGFVPALLVAVNRLYDPFQDEYLYTIDKNEYTANQNGGMDGEGAAFFIPARADEGREVYRLAYGTKHLYSTDPNEVKVAQQYGWTYEGVAFKSYK